ncbi:MAG: GNAT family N-acetyltransferase [Treponema sp.]|nr:GNAT family N-acetyltransferase [Treponema sp.]
MSLKIVQAEEFYIEEIMHVEKNCFIQAIQEEKEVFLSRMEKTPFFVFVDEESGKVAGYISAEYMEKVPEQASEIALNHKPSGKATDIIYISSFALLPEYRGTGLGKEMWSRSCSLFENLPGVKTLVLLVNEEWKGAFHIYENSGFKQIQVFQEFFPRNDGGRSSGILMVKQIVLNKMNVRIATKNDVTEIFAFVQKAVERMNEQGIPQWDEIYPTADDFASDAEKNQLYVAEIDGKPAACFTLSQECDEAYADGKWTYTGPDFLVIHRLCVNPEFQNQGAGTKVCREIEKIAIAAGMKSLKLDCFTLNPYSQKMYNKLGYKTVGYADWRKGRFILMEKILKD